VLLSRNLARAAAQSLVMADILPLGWRSQGQREPDQRQAVIVAKTTAVAGAVAPSGANPRPSQRCWL
jgi:hypothetical protein